MKNKANKERREKNRLNNKLIEKNTKSHLREKDQKMNFQKYVVSSLDRPKAENPFLVRCSVVFNYSFSTPPTNPD